MTTASNHPPTPAHTVFRIPWHRAGASIIDRTGIDVLVDGRSGDEEGCGYARDEETADLIVDAVNEYATAPDSAREREELKALLEEGLGALEKLGQFPAWCAKARAALRKARGTS